MTHIDDSRKVAKVLYSRFSVLPGQRKGLLAPKLDDPLASNLSSDVLEKLVRETFEACIEHGIERQNWGVELVAVLIDRPKLKMNYGEALEVIEEALGVN